MAVAGQVTSMGAQRQSHLRGWLVAGAVALALGGATTLGARTGVLAPVWAQMQAQVSADAATGQYQQIAAAVVNHRTAEQTAIAYANTAGYGYLTGVPQVALRENERAIRDGVVASSIAAGVMQPSVGTERLTWGSTPTFVVVKTTPLAGGAYEFEVASEFYDPALGASGQQGLVVDIEPTASGWKVSNSRGLTDAEFNALNSQQ